MTDYDEIRTCCSDKAICKKCWKFVAVAVEVLDEVFRKDFGWKHLLWVYSGRRGIHCWVSDRSACQLGDDARKAIVGYLEVVRGSANQVKKVQTGADFPGRSLHPALRRVLGGEDGPGPCAAAFSEIILQDQDCFRETKGWQTLLQLLPPKETDALARLKAKWEKNPRSSSMEKWTDVMNVAKKKEEVWKPYCEDIILQFTYPRIDANVSKHLNHLLKSPFVVHPSTGKVCVPLEAKQVASFDPEEDCPKVIHLLHEQDQFVRQWKKQQQQEHKDGQPAQQRIADPHNHAWDNTRLKPFVEIFDRHCQGIVRETDQLRRGEFGSFLSGLIDLAEC